MSNSIEGGKNPILILGGTGEICSVIAYRLATRFGFETYLGSRGSIESQEKFQALSTRITKAHGIEPKPFYANLAHEDQVKLAVACFPVPEGEKIDLFLTAAEGINYYGMYLARILVGIKRQHQNQTLGMQALIDATKAIKQITRQKKILDAARETNTRGSLSILNKFIERGNITPDSVVVTLSSVVSDYTNPKDMDSYPGPEFYVPVGLSKAEQVLQTAQAAHQVGFTYVDIVASVVSKTGVGIYAEKIIDWEASVVRKMPKVPFISQRSVATGVLNVYQGIKQGSEQFQKVPVGHQRWYIFGRGSYSKERPASWPQPTVPYL